MHCLCPRCYITYDVRSSPVQTCVLVTPNSYFWVACFSFFLRSFASQQLLHLKIICVSQQPQPLVSTDLLTGAALWSVQPVEEFNFGFFLQISSGN